MASIEKRLRGGQTRWYARYRDPAGEQRTRTFDRRIDAEHFLLSVESSKAVGAYVDPARAKKTVGEMATQWLAGKVNLRPTTRARYEGALSVQVLPRWAGTPLARVEHGDIQIWVSTLSAAGLSGASVRKAYGVFSGILALAVRDRRIPLNPAVGTDLPPLNQRRRRYLTAEQVAQLGHASGPHGRLVVMVLAYCGLRWSEMAGLRVGRVDLMRRRLNIVEAVTEVNGSSLVWAPPKSHEHRSVPVPRVFIDALALHMAGLGPDDLVFRSFRGGVLRNRTARRSWFDAAAVAIGEPGLTPHELRHTAASLAVSAGANVKAVQRMLGHKSAAMTLDTYADLFDDDLDDVAERLDAVARAADVYPMCTDAKLINLPSSLQMAQAQ